MAVEFNAGEVLEIAQQIERNGACFYRRAACMFDDEEVSGMLLNLADMEDAHRRVFAAMERELSENEHRQPAYDPYGEANQYLRALAQGDVFDLRADPTDWLDSEPATGAAVLRRAIDVEKDSILFYLGMKRSVPARLGKDRIDEVIHQEMNHMTLLANRLRFLEGSRKQAGGVG